jgi:hypothetical protein
MMLQFYPGKKSPGLTFLYHKSIIEEDGNVKEFGLYKPNFTILKLNM